MKNILKILGKIPEIELDMRNPNKIFGAHENDFSTFHKLELAIEK